MSYDDEYDDELAQLEIDEAVYGDDDDEEVDDEEIDPETESDCPRYRENEIACVQCGAEALQGYGQEI